LIALFLSGCAIFALSITSLSLKNKYPKINCLDPVKGYFFNEYELNYKAIKKDAIKEFSHGIQQKELGRKETFSGPL